MNLRTGLSLAVAGVVAVVVAVVALGNSVSRPTADVEPEVPTEPMPAPPAEAPPPRRMTPPPVAPAIAEDEPEIPEGAVVCEVEVVADRSRSAELPPLVDPIVTYRPEGLDDPDHPPHVEAEVIDGKLVFLPPDGVQRGRVVVADYLESSIAWSEAGCARALLRPAALVQGRVDPAYGDPQVIGCGTSVSVDPDGRFFMPVAPGKCDLRAVRDDDGLLVSSESVDIDVDWGAPGPDVELFLPED